jgi:hypothetical protein
MVAVTIRRDPLCLDPANQIAKENWPKLIEERRNFCTRIIPTDCRSLLFFMRDGEQSGWLGFVDRAAYCEGLGLAPEMVELALRGLELTDPNSITPLHRAVALGQREIGIEGGKAGPGRGHKTSDNVTRFQRGNQRAYILARLHRDRPDLAQRVEAGELSANAAAIEAGFRKKPEITCPHCGHRFQK